MAPPPLRESALRLGVFLGRSSSTAAARSWPGQRALVSRTASSAATHTVSSSSESQSHATTTGRAHRGLHDLVISRPERPR
jgi:hypothetical protein